MLLPGRGDSRPSPRLNTRPSCLAIGNTTRRANPVATLLRRNKRWCLHGRIAAACPELEPLRPGGLTFGAVEESAPREEARKSLECFVGLFEIKLDGAPLEGLRFDWHTEPTERVPGAIAYLDVRELPAGRHLLEIETPRGRSPESAKDEDESRLVAIPFWR